MKHTPLPWFSRKVSSQNIFIYPDKDCIGESIAGVGCIKNTRDRREGPANAAFITLACNSHYELLQELKYANTLLKRLAGDNYDSRTPDALISRIEATPNTEEAKGER